MYVSCGYFKSLYICELGGNWVEFVILIFGFILDEFLEYLGEMLVLLFFLELKWIVIEVNFYKDM